MINKADIPKPRFRLIRFKKGDKVLILRSEIYREITQSLDKTELKELAKFEIDLIDKFIESIEQRFQKEGIEPCKNKYEAFISFQF